MQLICERQKLSKHPAQFFPRNSDTIKPANSFCSLLVWSRLLLLKDLNCRALFMTSPQWISADGCEQDTPPWLWSLLREVLRSLSDFSTGESGCSGDGADIGAFADSCWLWARSLLLLCLSSLNVLAMTLRLSGMLLGGCSKAPLC